MAKYRMVFSYDFRFQDLVPLVEFQQVAEEESALGVFVSQPLMGEELITKKKEEGGVMAEAAGEKTYMLTYYNPATRKTELLESRTDIRIRDHVTRMIEESIAMRSVYPLYGFIGTPIMKQEIVLWKLEQILAEREYGTPPPFAGGAPVAPEKLRKEKKSEIIAIQRHEEEIKAAVGEAIVRKEKSERKMGEEILLLEEVVAALRKGEAVEKVLERLPPLSRARYMIALRRFNRQTIIELLIHDVSFLKKVKKKLEMFTLGDLLDMVRILHGLRKESTS